MSLTANKEAPRQEQKQRERPRAELLWLLTIWLAPIPTLSFALSYVPMLSGWAWLKPLYQLSGVCDGIAFFFFMYFQFVFDRTELLEPTKRAIEATKGILGHISEEITAPSGIHSELSEISRHMGQIGNTIWLPDSAAYMGRLMTDLRTAVASEPDPPQPILRLLRLSGHWRMNERLTDAAAFLEELFNTIWEVQMLYAVENKEAVDALVEEQAILGRLFSAQPSIGMTVINEDVAFLAFDESTDDPFPEEGLVIHGKPIRWFVNWFDEMFDASCSVKVYDRGKPQQDGMTAIVKTLSTRSTP